MPRMGVTGNRPVAEDRENAAQSGWESPAERAEADTIRQEARDLASAQEEVLTSREARSRREVPETMTDVANSRKGRALPAPNALRGNLSSNMKKELAKVKGTWMGNLPKTRHLALSRVIGDRSKFERVAQSLRTTIGIKSELSPGVRRRVEGLDRSIQEFEATNEREHIVYSTLLAPHDHGNSRTALRHKLQQMVDDPAEPTLTFDSYIPASHTMGQIKDSPDIVMEIRTRSGAYLGTSDTTPNADHLVSRGRTLRPVSVDQAPYLKADGNRGTRWVVQMEDVSSQQ